jgi:hypothetical protein
VRNTTLLEAIQLDIEAKKWFWYHLATRFLLFSRLNAAPIQLMTGTVES